MPRSIADRRAKLQENGEKGWMRRVATNNNSCDELKLLKDKNRYNTKILLEKHYNHQEAYKYFSMLFC
ncbi:hypothetical protein GWI33_013706 [Rhynchophorus ferrugineus]|uniref:Uncharacterized protein n=1 Tax=Rhynchophorus ferrugineus TaxID=354439 RepID=A0A834M7K9_RHYFE|nr:hypothetical protein GWI33_013706 [Rhynchophorus ferrugineus]